MSSSTATTATTRITTKAPTLSVYLSQTIPTRPSSAIPLLLCTFISGLSDSAAFLSWSTFLSMQTGNTVFLALGASGQPISPPDAWLKALSSIAAFLSGCFLFARSMRSLGHGGHSRAALVAAFALQAACFLGAAALVQAGVVPVAQGRTTPADRDAHDARLIEMAPIVLLAFQAGGQIVASRLLGFGEIPTTVLTSVYCDTASDARVFARRNEKRDRRVASVLCLLLGGISGGWLSRSAGGMAAVCWLGGGLKVVIALAWLVWPEEVVKKVDAEADGAAVHRGAEVR